MTITCSHCDMPYLIVTDDTIVACSYCGTRTFSPGADDWEEEEEEDEWAEAAKQRRSARYIAYAYRADTERVAGREEEA